MSDKHFRNMRKRRASSLTYFNSLNTGYPYTDTLVNSEDSDEMPHFVQHYNVLHYVMLLNL